MKHGSTLVKQNVRDARFANSYARFAKKKNSSVFYVSMLLLLARCTIRVDFTHKVRIVNHIMCVNVRLRKIIEFCDRNIEFEIYYWVTVDSVPCVRSLRTNQGYVFYVRNKYKLLKWKLSLPSRSHPSFSLSLSLSPSPSLPPSLSLPRALSTRCV